MSDEVTAAAPKEPAGALTPYEESIKEAYEAVKEDSHEYTDFLNALREGKPWTTIIKEGGEAMAEAGEDLEKVVPAVQNIMHAITTGSATSEFKVMSQVNRGLTVLAILAPVLEMGLACIKAWHGMDAVVQGNSFILSGAMMFFKTFLATRYANMRENIKIAAIENSGKVELVEAPVNKA